MAKPAITGVCLVRTILLATTALALPATPFGIGEAAAKVGVTSATDGDPLGKPPSEAERVLRIGIDVQANELITTRANDRAHVLFLDGTSLTVGPDAQLTIDRYVFDPATKTGELAINASRGVLRLVGGKISKTTPMVVTTPSSTIGVRGGITILDIKPNQTVSTFVFGSNMTVSAGGRTQTVTRPGSQVTTNAGGTPGQPALASQASLNSQISHLEGGGGASGGGTGQGGGNADQAAQSSGFSKQNSGQGTNVSQVTTNDNFGRGPGPRNRNPNDTITNAISNSQQVVQQDQLVQQAQAQTPTQGKTQTQTQILTQTTQTQTQIPITPTPLQPPIPTPPPTVIVTRGGFAMEPSYTNFIPQTLGVTPVPGNRVQLAPTGTVSNGTATISLADGRSFSVPWQPGSGSIAISITHPTLGPLNGTGFVSPAADFFAYGFTDSNGKKVGFVGGTPTTLAQFPTTGFATHVLSSLDDSGRLPFSNATVGKDPALMAAATVSPLYSVYSSQTGSPVGSPAPNNQGSAAMQSTVAISGQGAGQKSYMGVFIGDYFRDYNNNTNFNSGGFTSTYRTSSTDLIGRQASAASTFDTGGGNSIYGPNANYMVYTPDGARTDITTSGGVTTSGTTTRTPQASLDQPYTNLSGSDYTINTLATKVATPSTVGQTRTNQTTTNGFVGGMVESRDSSGNFSNRIIGGGTAGNGSFNAIGLATSATNNRVNAGISISNWDGTTTSALFQLGGTTGGRFSTSAFVDDKIYAVRDRPLSNFPAGPTTSVTVNGVTSTGADVTSRTTIVSYNAAPVANFFASAGVTPCTCDFMTWGWWGGDVSYGANSVYNPGGRDRIHLGTYVAGTQTPIADLNALTGTATYTGHMIGNVQNGNNAYVAAGMYSNQWNYGARNGIATMTYDGATFGGGASPNTASGGSPAIFTPTPLTSNNGRSITLNGAFFSSPTTPAKGQAGNFAITGPAYKSGGIFAAQKP